MDVSICIVNWNAKDLIKKCIKSIYSKTDGVTFEIIVVDNGSSDGSVEMLKKYFPDCILIENENVGFAKANNRASKIAKGKYVLYLNPDTELITNAIYGMWRFLENHNGFGAAGVKLKGIDGKIQYPCARDLPTLYSEMCYLFSLNYIFRKNKYFTSCDLDYWDHENSRPIECLSGACIMIRKDLNKSLGGFDEKFFMFSEDTDLCFRIKQKGFSIYYLASEEIWHFDGGSIKETKTNYFSEILQKHSRFLYIKKQFGDLDAKKYKILTSIGSIYRILTVITSWPILIFFKNYTRHMIIGIIKKYQCILEWSIGIKKVEPLLPDDFIQKS